MQLLLFVALTGVAFLFDEYFEEHPAALKEFQKEKKENSAEHGTIYLFTQSVNMSAKSPVQKISERKIYDQLHNKFLQKSHQLRNNHVLKTETESITQPLFLSYHHFIFRHYFFTHPDDDPLIS